MTKLFGISEAAKFLGLSVAGVRRHVYISGRLKPIKIGHSLVFTKEQLNKFIANRRKAGRPRKDNKS